MTYAKKSEGGVPMNQVVAFLKVEKKAEQAFKRCRKKLTKKQCKAALRRWLKLELAAAKLGRNAEITLSAKKLRRYSLDELSDTASDLLLIRHGEAWVH